MKNIDSLNHVRGESIYVDDVPVREGCLHAAVFAADVAHAAIDHLDVQAARAESGVVAVLTATDIPGENQIGNIVLDEPLFAAGEVHFHGQPIALVVAESESVARAARERIEVRYTSRPVVVDPREAHAAGDFIVPPRTFALGDPGQAFGTCAHVFEGQVEIGGQEHLYIETQGAYAYPTESGDVHVVSSTQGPTAVQRTAARVLGLPMHRIVVDVRRLGGGFGGKEDQATAWAVMAALAAKQTGRPVKLCLHRLDDMAMTGKRHPYSADFKIGLAADLSIEAYEVDFFQNAGAAADLSPAVLERTLFHATNSYFVPNVRATASCCRTNLPPFTAFRGFGGPQGMLVLESAIAKAAESLGVRAAEIQQKNLLREGDEFPYGQKTADCRARPTWELATDAHDYASILAGVREFNAAHTLKKRGLACMPVCFGISFTKTAMNQARALVHVYHDGSVGVSTGAVEMGQGVNTKLVQVAAQTLGIEPSKVKIETTNTTRIANTSPSAASATADLNGKAVVLACERIRERLLEHARGMLGLRPGRPLDVVHGHLVGGDDGPDADLGPGLTFQGLVKDAHLARVSLSEHAHYATPSIHFDPKREKGEPFAYHVYGTAIVTAEVDCLRGTYEILRFAVAHDNGVSLNESVDRGQIEGGIVQGMGWMTCEDLVFDETGRLRSDALSTYKVPDVFSAPQIDLVTLPAEPDDAAIFGSKAVGEPPLMYGIGAYFALRDAVREFRPGVELPFVTPMTPERVLLGLCGDP